MKFAHPDAVFWFFLLPVLLLIAFLSSWKKKREWNRLAEPGLRGKIISGFAPGRQLAKHVLLFFSFIFLVLALMEPQWGMREEEVKMKGVDLMVLTDVSNSMLAQDVKPSRLERAKRKLRDLFDMLAGDRVGLIAFAGRSFLLSPLTLDYGTLNLFLDEIQPQTIPVQGTDIAGAIGLALKAFSDSQSTKAILLITDGEDHSQRMEKVIEVLTGKRDVGEEIFVKVMPHSGGPVRREKIPVYVLGIGTPEGGPVPNEGGGFKTAESGEPVISKLNESFLKDLALRTGGAYVRAVTGDEDLQELYVKGVRGDLEGGELKVSKMRVWETRYYWPLALALIFLILERLIPEGRRQTLKGTLARS